MVFHSFIQSKLSYASAAWQPWISNTNMSLLDRAQNKALRFMTGQAKSSPLDAIRLESGIPSYETTSNRHCLIAREKALRCPPDHPLRIAAESDTPRRLVRNNWRAKSASLVSQLPEAANNRMPLHFYPVPPWNFTSNNVTINDCVPGINGKSDLD